MNMIGFDSSNEFLPAFDKFHSQVNKRKMFLKLFNQEVSCSLKFSKTDLNACKNKDLFTIFLDKIFCLLEYDFDTKKAFNSFSCDIEKTNKINSFLESVNKKTNIHLTRCDLCISKKTSDINKALKLISYLNDNELEIYLEGEKVFKNFVSNKILKNNESKTINVNEDSIDISSKDKSFVTKIFTFWEFINSQDLQIDKHIQKAVNCINTTDFKQIYLVYPKNENFNKHISVKTDAILSGEYEIKLIPYSLRSTLR